MIPPSTSDQLNHNGHLIIARSRYLAAGAWEYLVEVQAPDGNWWPPIRDNDHTFESSEDAVAEGMRVAIQIVDRQ